MNINFFVLFTRSLMLAVAVLANLVLTGCDWGKQQPILIAANKWPGYAPLFLARDEGWLDEQQVKLVQTDNLSSSLLALEAGKVDAAALTLPDVLMARANGSSISIVQVLDISAGGDALLARPDIRSLADIKGKRIAYEAEGALGKIMLAAILQTGGLSERDIRLVPIAPDRQLAAWKNNEVDAVITYEPMVHLLRNQGAVILFDSRQMSNTIVDVLAIRNEVLERNMRAVRQLLSASFRAAYYFKHNPQDAAYRMSQHLGLDKESVLHAFNAMILPDTEYNRSLLGGRTPLLHEPAIRLSNLMLGKGLIARKPPLDGLLRPDFLPESD
jgi:NitT/TauT family transport system substrate-binding protein